MSRGRPWLVRRAGVALVACGLGGPLAAAAVEEAQLPADLTQLSLDELLNVEVTSVSKRAEPLSQAAAAVYVLTGEQIRASGVRSIAEALRLVPGLHVARTDAQTQTYAISARGFNNGLADKLEVQLDGRSVYSPLFSGVFWDSLDTFLPDIDRIEVIRGPGAALWGANAVNGVINIVTKPAGRTQGVLAVGGGGTEERGFSSVRGGFALGERSHMRLYAKAFDRGPARMPNGDTARDGIRMQQLGLRADGRAGEHHAWTLISDGFKSDRSAPFATLEVSGANLLGRWQYQASEHSELSLKAYYDEYHRHYPTAYEERRRTADVDLQHRLRVGASQEWVYGFAYRNTHDRTEGMPNAFTFDPAARTLETWNAFVQDQIALAGGAGMLTLGSKFEHNDFTGFEAQPSIRLGWQLAERLFTWGAVSRAVRTPNRVNSDLTVFSTFRVGNPEVDSEVLIAYEWGLRAWTHGQFSADVALFYNDYDKLLGSEPGPSRFGHYENSVEGSTHGGEVNLNWQPHRALDLRLFYSHLEMDLGTRPGASDTGTTRVINGSNPRHIGGIEGHWQIGPGWSASGLLRSVSDLPATRVPAYTDLNLRIAWRARPSLEFSIAGFNLLDAQHPEFGIPNVRPLEAQRSVLGQVMWSWGGQATQP